MRKVGIATISYCNNPKEIKAGPEAILKIWGMLLERAAYDRPDIVLLPEHFALTGTQYKLADVAETIKGAQPGPVTQFLAAQARRHKYYIYACYPRRAAAPGRYYNSAVLFDRQGRIASVYDKTFPTVGEMERGILPGRGAVAFDADFGRIGAGICFDFNFRELFAEYRRQKTELFCFLSAFSAGFQVPIMAYENQMFIASAICGPKGRIVNPLGRVLKDGLAEGMTIFAEINLDCRVIHIDFNRLKMPALKAKYKKLVQVDTAGEEGVYLLTSLHPKVGVDQMIREFEMETLDDYFQRSRRKRARLLARQRMIAGAGKDIL